MHAGTLLRRAVRLLLLMGCVIPIPSGNYRESRENIADSAPVAIDVGTTTCEDVLMLLGEPDAVAIDEPWIANTSQCLHPWRCRYPS